MTNPTSPRAIDHEGGIAPDDFENFANRHRFGRRASDHYEAPAPLWPGLVVLGAVLLLITLAVRVFA
jgi:hypothetical protein